ncbi:nucleoid-associated protein [Vallitalea guaymasensis]|uniref:nucleoid-associated protein n=1 Tax=Vallitalea guaymasensis TaxID=1185412 RepID=UPI00187D4778|nr:nucleoid-associated protein [Vallitalea guaymasensis]
MKIIYSSLYHIDIVNHIFEKKQINTNDVKDYIFNAVYEMIDNKNKRYYKIRTLHKEVIHSILSIYTSPNWEEDKTYFDTASSIIANRLKETEEKTSDRYGHLNDLQKGSLIQVIYEDALGHLHYLLAKIEHNKFLDVEDLKFSTGLLVNNRTYKICDISFIPEEGESYQVDEIIIADSNRKKISEYWYDGFLEMDELQTDNENTRKAFSAIDNYLNRNVKKQAPADYTIIRNGTIQYFRTQPQFNITEYNDYVFGSYTPESDELNLEVIKEKISDLPRKKSFDSSFSLVPTEVKAKFKREYPITAKIELKIKEDIANIRDEIKAIEEHDKKYLKILITDNETYNLFKY